MASLMVKARQLVHEYIRRDEEGNPIATQTALDHVDIDIQPGSFVAVLGHNGSGKSTLAKHLNVLLCPTEGTLWVDGKDTSDPDKLWDIRQNAGMVFQNPDNQIIGSIVEEDVGFGPENLGVPTDEIWQRVEDSLQAVGMMKFRSASPNKLSGGQKQRVAIAGVVAMQPACIVLDEPTAMLDPQGRREVIDTIERLSREQGITIVLITHHMKEAARAQRVIAMREGKILADGTPDEVFSQVELLRNAGLAVPETTELLYTLNEAGCDFPLGAYSAEACAGLLLEYIRNVQQ